MSRLTLAVTVLGLAIGVAAAAEFPVISIERTCGAAKPLDALDTSPVETCLRDEREARAARSAVGQVRGEQPQRLRPADLCRRLSELRRRADVPADVRPELGRREHAPEAQLRTVRRPNPGMDARTSRTSRC